MQQAGNLSYYIQESINIVIFLNSNEKVYNPFIFIATQAYSIKL